MTTTNSKDNDKDLEFIYDDCDEYKNEISELYSYTEEVEFDTNLKNFQSLLKDKGYSGSWNELDQDAKELLVMHIIQVIEHADKDERFKAVTWLLYLVQGTYGECTDAQQQAQSCRANCILLYKKGVFPVTRELLMMEVGVSENHNPTSKKSTQLTIADSKELRSLFMILYTMVETMRQEDVNDSPDMKSAREEFLHDLGQNLGDNEPLVIVLFNMVVKFCSDTTSNLPMKKVLLLIWKLLLTVLGGFKSIDDAKIQKRKDEGLPVLDEDPIQIVREMKASVPPTSASDILEIAQAPKRRRGRSTLYELDSGNTDTDLDENRGDKVDNAPLEEEKVTSIDDELMESSNPVEKLTASDMVEVEETVVDPFLDKTNGVLVMGGEDLEKEETAVEPGVTTPIPIRKAPTLSKDTASIAAKLIKLRKQQQEAEIDLPVVKLVSGLPWIPKAREKDVEAFLNLVRQKFIGFPLPGDLTTEAGLPNPTQDSIAVLRRHQYKSLIEIQVDREAEISKYPLTLGKKEVVPDTLTERLYQAMLPHLPQYMIALLKILLAAAPTAKSKNESINILTDVLPEEMPNSTVLTMKVGIDVNRHREIIVKSVSGILLLLLKHFKLSHVYQFEYASQHLVFANCIPLVLKFFNQNIVAYVTTKNTIPSLEFPECVIGEKKDLTAESLEGIDTSTSPCWRNLFSSISLLRILNKLVKWKHSRTMMLVVFKSAPILKRALKVRQAMFQLYVLKLLKVQTKYLGRQWRKSNMKIMSAIYQKVRHRLNDDWAYGNDLDARPWDFQQEECALRAFVERFNLRRYHVTGSRTGGTPNVTPEDDDADYQPVDNNIQNLLREEMDLPSDFQKSYDVWLEREVYCSSTDWDQLMTIPCVQ